jgi:O-antigen/teichoic acid export membrane protein
MTAAAITPEELREKTVRSVKWVALLQALVGVLFFGVPLVLSYLVSPADLGLLELLVSVFALAVLLVELGTIPAVVQRRDASPAFLSTVFWVNVTAGLVWAVAITVIGPFLAAWLGFADRLRFVWMGIGISLVFTAFGVVPRALLVRRMEFRRATLARAFAILCTVGAAFVGMRAHGVPGVVWAMICFALLTSAGLWWASGFRPTRHIEKGEIVPLLKFGGSTSAAMGGEQLGQQMERFLIARFLGMESWGLFVVTKSLIRDPLRHLMSVVEDILLPGLSALQNDPERTRRYYLAAMRYELALFGPIMAFIAVFAQELTELFYGDAWLPVAVIAQLLVFQSWRMITGHSLGTIFLSQGRPDVRLKWVLWSLVLVPLIFFAGLPWGIRGYAASCSVVGVFGWALAHNMANGLLGISWARFWKALSRPLAAHLSLAVLLIALRALFQGPLDAHPRTSLFFIPPALLLYVGLLALLDRPLLTGVLRTGREVLGFRVRPKEGAAPEPPLTERVLDCESP